MNHQHRTNNMYSWVDKTRNFLAGQCLHQCKYCYVQNLCQRLEIIKKKYTGDIRLDEKAFYSLGKNKTWFICSCNDLFAEGVPDEFIIKILKFLENYPENEYLLQSKNPKRFCDFSEIPDNSILYTTIESNRDYPGISHAPKILQRLNAMILLYALGYNTGITIEPILDFDLIDLVEMIKPANPAWVDIGADSKNHGLPEPPYSKVLELINALKDFTKVRKKSNLERLKKIC